MNGYFANVTARGGWYNLVRFRFLFSITFGSALIAVFVNDVITETIPTWVAFTIALAWCLALGVRYGGHPCRDCHKRMETGQAVCAYCGYVVPEDIR